MGGLWGQSGPVLVPVLVAVLVLALGLVAAAVYLRAAPDDPARWHRPVAGTADRDFRRGVLRVVPAGPDGAAAALARLDAVIRATARTQVLAGSPAEGRITYVTRSAVWGFPDYTTAEARAGALAIHARARFGRSDLGVNRRRVENWIAALQAR